MWGTSSGWTTLASARWLSPAYLDALRSGSSAVEVSIDEDAIRESTIPATITSPCGPPRHRLSRAGADRTGVDTQVLTLTTPGTHVEAPATASASPGW